jgi:hypothetical protein
MTEKLKYVQRQGKYHYFRLPGASRQRLQGEPGSADYLSHYASLLSGKTLPSPHSRKKLTVIRKVRFRLFCERAVIGAASRAKIQGIPFAITCDDIEALLCEQNYHCAVTGIPLAMPERHKRKAFSPSIDRIIPALGYVPANLRIVGRMVNTAINDWGLEAFLEIARQSITHAEWRRVKKCKTSLDFSKT